MRVAVTGAAGQVGYALLPLIASGSVFGPDRFVELQLIEIPEGMKALEAVVMELHDCAFPLLKSVSMVDDLRIGLQDVSWAVLLGSVRRRKGMERKDLLHINGKTFVSAGRAIMDHAASDVRTLVVGNPCNTNCLIAMSNAKDVPDDRWFAMTRLDENRATAQLALKAGVRCGDVTNVAIWGNHSSTLFPDFLNAKIGCKLATDAIRDRAWLEGDFVESVQQRGAAVMEARGRTAACSAAHAVADTIRCIVTPTPDGDWNSVGLPSDGSYGIRDGVVCSFPTRSNGSNVEIVKGVPVNNFARAKIEASVNELFEERAVVRDLIPA